MTEPTDTERLDAIGGLGLMLVGDQIKTPEGWTTEWRCIRGDEPTYTGTTIREVIDQAIKGATS